MAVAAALALLSAFLYAVGSVAQQKAAAQVPTEEATGARLLGRLVRQPLWLIGVGGDVLGFAGQAVALGLGSLALVQPLLVTSLLFALPLGAAWAGRRLRPSDGTWAVMLTVGLAVFVVAGDPTEGKDTAPGGDWLPAAVVLVVMVVGCVVGARLSRPNRAVLMGIVTGTLFGVTAALVKSVISIIDDGIVELLTSWELYALVVAGVGGFVAQADAFQAGNLQFSMPVMVVLDPVVATVLGVTILDERIQAHGAEWALIGVAVIAMAVATIALARGAAEVEAVAGSAQKG